MVKIQKTNSLKPVVIEICIHRRECILKKICSQENAELDQKERKGIGLEVHSVEKIETYFVECLLSMIYQV